MIWSYSKIENDKVKKIEELESKLGVTLLAFSGQTINNAQLSTEDLELIKKLEDELQLSLVAVNV